MALHDNRVVPFLSPIGLWLCAVVVLNMLTRSVAAVPLRDGSGNVLQDYAFTPNAETDSTLLSFG